jgi:hypothetical protein
MNKHYTFTTLIVLILFMFACGGEANKNDQKDTTANTSKDTTPVAKPDTSQKASVADSSSSKAKGVDQIAQMIVNEWKVKEVLAPNGQTNAMDDKQKAMMENSSIIFNADGSQSMNVPLEKEVIKEEGRWKLAEEGKQVIMVSPSGKERIFKIEEITKDRLKLRVLIDMSGIVLQAKNAAPSGPVK